MEAALAVPETQKPQMQFTAGMVPGWVRSDLNDIDASGIWRPDTSAFSRIPDGLQVAYVSTGSGNISQVLPATLTADTRYELSTLVGRYQGAMAPAYAVQLLAGGSLLAQSTSPIPAMGDFIESIVDFTTTPGDLRIGQVLEIRLLSTEPARYPENWAHFDDIRLNAVSQLLGAACDFNGDGVLDLEDLESLTAAIQASSTDVQFDLDENGLVELVDRQHWVTEIRQTWIGDANLDGLFDSADMIAAFSTGGYEDEIAQNSTWSTGDWDGNGEFDSRDLIAAFSDGGYEMGVRASVSAVPEPAWHVILMACLFVVAIRSRHVGR